MAFAGASTRPSQGPGHGRVINAEPSMLPRRRQASISGLSLDQGSEAKGIAREDSKRLFDYHHSRDRGLGGAVKELGRFQDCRRQSGQFQQALNLPTACDYAHHGELTDKL